MVALEFTRPADISDAQFESLRQAEQSRAKELAQRGHLVRLWRPLPTEGRWSNVGLWRAVDEAELRGALATLPLFSWATAQITPLGAHPNDPGAA